MNKFKVNLSKKIKLTTCKIKNLSGLCPGFLKIFKNAWNFLSDMEYLCYTNEVTLVGPPMASGWALITKEINCVIKGLGLSAI